MWGKSAIGKGIACAKVLRQECVWVFKEQHEGQGSCSRISKGKSHRR